MPSPKAPFIILGLCVFIAIGLLVLFTNGFFERNKTISEKECNLFAKEIELSINQSDPSFLNESLNHYSFLKKVAKDLGPYNKNQLADLAVQVKENIRFGDMVMGYLKSNDGYFNFTKLYFQKYVPHIIFRIYSQREGLNYFDCELERINEKLTISDVYIYYAGELWSTSYSRHTKLLGENNKGDLNNIHPENDFHNSLLKIDYIRELLFLGNVELAEQLYFSIPEKFRKDKIFQGTGLKIAFQKSDSAYIAAINQYLSSDSKNEIFHRFFNVLRHLAAKENHEARQSIVELSELTGEDSLMQLFIGRTFQNEQLYQKSVSCFDNAIEHYPDLFETYWYKLVSLIQAKQYIEATGFLDTIIFNFEAKKIDLENLLDEYPTFVNSKAYLEWRNRLNI
jgi:tetratricopeptide (TPR) repeat protein